MKHIKTKAIIGTFLILTVLISGCTNNPNSNTNTANNSVYTETTPSSTIPSSTIPPFQVKESSNITTTYVGNDIKASNGKMNVSKNQNNTSLTTSNLDWCTSGKNITEGKIFTIQGTITDGGNTLCYAKSVQANGEFTMTTNYYFSHDGNIKRMNSSSVSSNGNSYSSANSSSSIS